MRRTELLSSGTGMAQLRERACNRRGLPGLCRPLGEARAHLIVSSGVSVGFRLLLFYFPPHQTRQA
jgi:hypothetical protein